MTPTASSLTAVLTGILLSAAARAGENGGGEGTRQFTAEERAWWAVQPVLDPEVPAQATSRNPHPVDAFIDRRLAKGGLTPAPEAGPGEFLRRACFDLHGLPPTPRQLEIFVSAWKKDRESAVGDLIDDLLASPRYGERWAQHWLDVVRYAESDGYREDKFRPDAFRYRDYVVRAFNEDKPYDEFVREQLAADEIAPDDPARLVATGFLRLGIYEWNQRNAEMQRGIIIDEMTRVTGEVFLGLGIGCAQCHDHKFDPILQEDYYALQAFLSSTCWPDGRMLGTPDELAAWREKQNAWEESSHEVREEIDVLLAEGREKARQFRIKSFPATVQAMFLKPASERSSYEEQIAMLVQRQVDREVSGKGVPDKIKKTDTPEGRRYRELLEKLKDYDAIKPAPLPGAFIATDTGTEPARVFMGNGDERAEVVPGVLTLLGEDGPEARPAERTTGRRRALADWIVNPENPFTSRVMVNRIWQYHFGRGLVATPNDFGTLGEPPTHPELLDWLAVRFVEGGWRMKPLHRLIMTSATYRRTARREPGDQENMLDPSNLLLSRFPPRRLGAEQVRDAMLAVSGELKHRDGGPSVEGEAHDRSIYVKKHRNTPDSMMQCFDSPAGFDSAPARPITTTPTQSLLLTNNPWPLARAKAFAKRVVSGRKTVVREDIADAFRLAWGREAEADEVESAYRYLRAEAEEQRGNTPPPKYVGETGWRPVTQAFGARAGLHLGKSALWLQPGSRFETLEIPGPGLDPDTFTIEAVVSLDRIHPDGRVNVIASQWNGDPSRKGWTFGVTSTKSRYQPHNLIVQLIGTNPGGDVEYEVVPSDLRVPLGRPVYMAAIVQCRPKSKGTVRFFLKELSGEGELQTALVSHNIAGDTAATDAPFLVGGRADRKGHYFDGQVARLRIAAGARDPRDLIVHGREGAKPPEAGDYLFARSDDGRPVPGSKWIGVEPPVRDPGLPVLEAFADFCHALLSSNEFLYLH